MCLVVHPVKYAKQSGRQPWNVPYNEHNIRYKVVLRNSKQHELRSIYQTNTLWSPFVTVESGAKQPDRIPSNKEFYRGIHVYVNKADAQRDCANKHWDYAIIAVEVKGFIASGTNNGFSIGEVWSSARAIGMIRPYTGRFYKFTR